MVDERSRRRSDWPALAPSRASLRKCLAKTPKRGLNAKNVPKPRWLSGQTSLNRMQINGFANVWRIRARAKLGRQLLKSPCDLRVHNANTGAILSPSNSSRGLSKDRWSRAQWRASRGCHRTARAPASAPERPTKDRKGTNTASEVGALPIRPTHVLSFDFKRAL